MIKYSVIMPVYNAGKTVENAVSSVLSSKRDDVELICINDGSIDNSLEILENIKNKDDRLKIFTVENSGPGNARNVGIDKARGEYVMFIDADDLYEKDIFDALDSVTMSDITIFGFTQTFLDKKKDMIYIPKTTDLNELYGENQLNSVWNKAYRRTLLKKNNIWFNDFRYGEDRIFNIDCLETTRDISVLEKSLYVYKIDDSASLISTYSDEKFADCVLIYKRFSILLDRQDIVNYMFLKNVVSCITVMFADSCLLSTDERKEKIKYILSDVNVIKCVESSLNKGSYIEIIRKIIKSKNVGLNYFFFKLVYFVQKRMLPIFLIFRK